MSAVEASIQTSMYVPCTRCGAPIAPDQFRCACGQEVIARWPLDVVSAVLGGIVASLVVALLELGFGIIPSFTDMFADFGATLPWVTGLAIHPWFAPVPAGALFLALAAAFIAPRTRSARAWALALALVLGLLFVGGIMVAMYLPIFAMADAVR